MTTTVLLSLIVVANSHVDPQDLSQRRRELEAYYSGISSVKLTFRREWTPSQLGLERNETRRQRAIDAADEKDREKVRREVDRMFNSKRWQKGELLYADPLLRLTQLETLTFPDGSVEERETAMYISRGKRTLIDKGSNQVIIDRPAPTARYPFHALGMRVPNSVNMSVTELLQFPHVTYDNGEGILGEVRTLVWTVGPQIPEKDRVPGWDADTTVKLWLAKDYHHLPVRLEIDLPGEQFYRLSMTNLKPASDVSRGRSLPFPRAVTFEDRAGVTTWDIEDVTINPRIGPMDFTPRPAPGMFTTQDGKPRTMAGGRDARAANATATAQLAADLLGSVTSEDADSHRTTAFRWATVIPVVISVLCVTLIFFIHRRRSHVR